MLDNPAVLPLLIHHIKNFPNRPCLFNNIHESESLITSYKAFYFFLINNKSAV